MVYENSTYVKEYVYYGTVASAEKNEDGTYTCVLEQKNKFFVGDTLEILAPGKIEEKFAKILKITDEDGNEMESCPHASQIIHVTVDSQIKEGDLFRGKAV
jgi:putative protease